MNTDPPSNLVDETRGGVLPDERRVWIEIRTLDARTVRLVLDGPTAHRLSDDLLRCAARLAAVPPATDA
jgi:hypothetical protein